MCNWILNLFVSGSCFGLADALCDIIIGEHGEEHHGRSTIVYEAAKKSDNHEIKNHSNEMTPTQTVFVCVVFTYILLFVYFFWIMWNQDIYMDLIGHESFLFQPVYDYKFFYALTAGIFCYLHYHYTIKAFETSASTVILPLLQFPSIFTFIVSSFHKSLLGLEWLESYMHLIAYAVLFIGGLLPATDGNLSEILTKRFWKQPFVQCAIIAEVNHGFYNMCISTVEDSIKNNWQFMEYFAITRIMFVIAFVVYLIISRKVQDECWKIKYVAPKQIWTTFLAEALTIFGYFNSAMAYQCYYQTGVVTAAESALNQLLNLVFAYSLKSIFGLGREASITGVPVKFVSAILIALGLYLAGGAH